jgi:hypothetical protein
MAIQKSRTTRPQDHVRRPTRDQIDDSAASLYFAEAKLTELRSRLREYSCEEMERAEPEVGFAGTDACWRRRLDFEDETVELCQGCQAREQIVHEIRAAREVRNQRRRSWLGLMRRHVRDVESSASLAELMRAVQA